MNLRNIHNYLLIVTFSIVFFLYACSDENDFTEPKMIGTDNIELSGTNIQIKVADTLEEVADTRATLYNSTTINQNNQYLKLYSNYSSGGTAFFSELNMRKTKNAYMDEWFFIPTANYYWPKTAALDFFAYMPYDLDNTGVTYDTYTHGTGHKINCSLPYTSSSQASTQEFIYAYTINQTRDNNMSGVNLVFQHPFSLIYIDIAQALQELTLNSVTIKDIYVQGQGTLSSSGVVWTDTGTKQDFVVTVNKTMGADGDSGMSVGRLAGPFIVKPQSFTNGEQSVDVNITYTKQDFQKSDGTNLSTGTYTLTQTVAVPNGAWESGMPYVYSLDLGRDGKGIIMKVLVEPWEDQGDYTTHNIE